MLVVEPSKPKLLVVELWGLGDLVIATPFLRAASEKFTTTLLAKPYGQALAARLWPLVNVVPFVAPWTAFRHKYRLFTWPWKELFRLRKLRSEGFEVGLSARWDPRDHFLLLAFRAGKRFGFSRLGSQFLLTDPLIRPGPAAHRYEHWRTLARALGLDLSSFERVQGRPMQRSGPVVVHTGAGQPVRVWPLDRYRSLVAHLRRQNYQVLVACDPEQQPWWRAAGETQVATPCTVTELAGLFEGAGAFIGNDSGPGHLAAMLGVPTFTLFGPQIPAWFAPLHPQAEWLEGSPCRYKPCSDYCRFPVPACLWDLDQELVASRVERFVAKHMVESTATNSTALTMTRTGYLASKPRRFIQVFCRYLMRGGEENSVARIALHLERAGHQVTRFWRASSEWNGPTRPPLWQQMRLAWSNTKVLGELGELHRREKPDAWIFHNIIPVVSLGGYRLGLDLRVPIIQWMHNYRPISPSGTLRAGGKMLQPEDRWLAWKEAWQGTWRGRLPTAALALAYARLRQRGDFASVKAWIAVSDQMQQLFIRAGYPRERFFCLHHSWDTLPPVDLNLDEGYFLFLGRMVKEKGVEFLMDLWRRPELKDLQLVMAGEGPLADAYRPRTPSNIRWVGFVQDAEKRRLLAGCRALLFPCLWEEPLTTVVYEAYEQGKPVLASALGGLKELVFDSQTGRLLLPGVTDAWIQAILQYAREPAFARDNGIRGLTWLQNQVSADSWNRQFDEILSRILPAKASKMPTHLSN